MEDYDSLINIHQTLSQILLSHRHQTPKTDLEEIEELKDKFTEIINKIKSGIIKDIIITKDEYQDLINIHDRLFAIIDDRKIELSGHDSIEGESNKKQLFNNLIIEINKKNKLIHNESVIIHKNEQDNMIDIFRILIENINKSTIPGIISNDVKCDLKKMTDTFYKIINKDKLKDEPTIPTTREYLQNSL